MQCPVVVSKTPDVQTYALLNQISKKKKFKPVLIGSRKTKTIPASPTKASSIISKTPMTKKSAAVVQEKTEIELHPSREKILLLGGDTYQVPKLGE